MFYLAGDNHVLHYLLYVIASSCGSAENVFLLPSCEIVFSLFNSETRGNIDLVGDGGDGNGSSFIRIDFEHSETLDT
jgi:hypothetical protein